MKLADSDAKTAYHLQENDPPSRILKKHKAVFQDELGKIHGTTAKLQVDPEVHPQFYKPRPVPFSLRKKVEDELARLEKEGVIAKKQFSEWAGLIVPVPKEDGSVRICGLQGDSQQSGEGGLPPDPRIFLQQCLVEKNLQS